MKVINTADQIAFLPDTDDAGYMETHLDGHFIPCNRSELVEVATSMLGNRARTPRTFRDPPKRRIIVCFAYSGWF